MNELWLSVVGTSVSLGQCASRLFADDDNQQLCLDDYKQFGLFFDYCKLFSRRQKIAVVIGNFRYSRRQSPRQLPNAAENFKGCLISVLA